MIDVAESDKVGGGDGGDCKDGIGKRSPCSKNSNGATSYLTPDARRTFTQLKQTFTEAPILQYFDPEYHTRIKTDMSSYVIGGVLSQLTDLG